MGILVGPVTLLAGLSAGTAPRQGDSLVVLDSRIRRNGANGVEWLGLGEQVMGVAVRYSEITERENGHGFSNQAAAVADARFNWWGHPSGPGGVGPGWGDKVTQNVVYFPWKTGGGPIADSDRLYASGWNNARKAVRTVCPPGYKVVFESGSGVFITMTHDPAGGQWCEPIEIWPVDMPHYSSDAAIAIGPPGPDSTCHPDLYVAWAEHIPDETAPGEIYVSVSTDGGFTWSVPVNVSRSDAPSEHPSIAVEGRGIAHAVWEEGLSGATRIFYSHSEFGYWSPPMDIVMIDGVCLLPSIASNPHYVYASGTPDDRIFIAWTMFPPVPGREEWPWIAFRMWDWTYGWLPPLSAGPEDATAGTGGAAPRIVGFELPSGSERVPAVVWHWPVEDVYPPTQSSQIVFNIRTGGVWGEPRPVTALSPSQSSILGSLALGPGEVPDTMWVAWEQWDLEGSRSQVYLAYSVDLGESWQGHTNVSQTRWDLSVRPSLAYQFVSGFKGFYDPAWTEVALDADEVSSVWFIGATEMLYSAAQGVPQEDASDGREKTELLLHVTTNPARGAVCYVLASAEAQPVRVFVYGPEGRLVWSRRLDVSGRAHGVCDGTDVSGVPVPSGIYLVRAVGRGSCAVARVLLLH